MEKKKQSSRKQTSNKKNIAKKVEVVKDEPVVTEVKEVKQVTKESKTKSHDHSLFKALAILILIAVVLTWIIPSGYFNGADYIESDIDWFIVGTIEDMENKEVFDFDLYYTKTRKEQYYIIEYIFQ